MADDAGPDPQGQSIVAIVPVPGVDMAAVAGWLADAAVPLLGTGGSKGAAQSDDVLAACQSTWWAPPEYRPGWKDDAAVVAATHHQLKQLEALPSSAAWLDRDHALLIDLWFERGAAIGSAVLLWSAPEDAVTALGTHGIKRHHALALWEHAVRHALEALAGRRTYVCTPGVLVKGGSDLEAFLPWDGLSMSALPALTHAPGLQNDAVPTELTALVEILHNVSGSHDELPEVSLPSPSASSEELLSAHRAVSRVGAEAKEAWLLADQQVRTSLRLQTDMSQTMAEVNHMVEHLLNAM